MSAILRAPAEGGGGSLGFSGGRGVRGGGGTATRYPPDAGAARPRREYDCGLGRWVGACPVRPDAAHSAPGRASGRGAALRKDGWSNRRRDGRRRFRHPRRNRLGGGGLAGRRRGLFGRPGKRRRRFRSLNRRSRRGRQRRADRRFGVAHGGRRFGGHSSRCDRRGGECGRNRCLRDRNGGRRLRDCRSRRWNSDFRLLGRGTRGNDRGTLRGQVRYIFGRQSRRNGRLGRGRAGALCTKATMASRCSGVNVLSWFFTSMPCLRHRSSSALLSMSSSCAR